MKLFTVDIHAQLTIPAANQVDAAHKATRGEIPYGLLYVTSVMEKAYSYPELWEGLKDKQVFQDKPQVEDYLEEKK